MAVIVAVIGFLVYRYYLEPPISRQFMAAKWKKGTPAFIQDNANVVHFTMSDTELPEGIVHNKRGFFLLPRPPYIPSEDEKRGPGRPPKDASEKGLSPEQEQALGVVLQVPTLAGLGKSVFFGYDGSPLLSNLKTLAYASASKVRDEIDESKKAFLVNHADLRALKEIIPATISRTQLGNLYRWALAKGYAKKGGDQMKFLILIAGLIGLVATVGIVAYLLLNGGKPA